MQSFKIWLSALAFVVVMTAGATTAEAKLDEDTAKAADQAYSLRVISDLANTAITTSTSEPLDSRLFRRSATTFRYLEHWAFVDDVTKEPRFDCWIHIILTGDRSKVKITLYKNGNPCKVPPKATFYPRSNRLTIP